MDGSAGHKVNTGLKKLILGWKVLIFCVGGTCEDLTGISIRKLLQICGSKLGTHVGSISM